MYIYSVLTNKMTDILFLFKNKYLCILKNRNLVLEHLFIFKTDFLKNQNFVSAVFFYIGTVIFIG